MNSPSKQQIIEKRKSPEKENIMAKKINQSKILKENKDKISDQLKSLLD